MKNNNKLNGRSDDPKRIEGPVAGSMRAYPVCMCVGKGVVEGVERKVRNKTVPIRFSKSKY